jgi:hypothetical protein
MIVVKRELLFCFYVVIAISIVEIVHQAVIEKALIS